MRPLPSVLLIAFALLVGCSGHYGDPLLDAAYRGDIGALQRLLKSGADVNRTNSLEQTALYVASYRSNTNVIRFLISSGADLKVRCAGLRDTPLHAAAYADQVAVVGLLLASGADVNGTNAFGHTPLYDAVAL